MEQEQLKGGVWVKASERLPEKRKYVNGKLKGRPVIVYNMDLTKGYISANHDLERVEDVEWLDELAFDELIQQNQLLQEEINAFKAYEKFLTLDDAKIEKKYEAFCEARNKMHELKLPVT